jgi:para-aminobenzoate synthetase/4-amino-4-deoxychorismate lyase
MTVVLLETLIGGNEESKNIWISNPERIVQTSDVSRVDEALWDVEDAVSSGYLAAGFISYETGYHFLPNMPVVSSGFPLVWFALTKTYENQAPGDFETRDIAELHDLTLDTTPDEYSRAIASIREHIADGNTYQVNYTMRYRGEFRGSTRTLYRQLCRKQRVSYAAYVETDQWSIISLSPELFFRRKGNRLLMRPMKGTARRGRTLTEDRVLATELLNSAKERAENLMIVDLLRNDLGKVCEAGTVSVSQPLVVERYETVLQMTSQIEGVARKDLSFGELMKAVFPSGSVTGAPKLRTMQIIEQLEKSPRRIYTGCIGFVSPEETVFSVAIRTAVIHDAKLEMGVGSGILYEADATREYEECKLKAHFLTDPSVVFELIETILWLPGSGYQRLSLHLDRLLESAEYFLIPLERQDVMQLLQQKIPSTITPMRVRLTVDRDGKMEMSTTELEALSALDIRWAFRVTNSENAFLFHKTTHRPLQQSELSQAREEGYLEVIFRNERDEVTEGAFSNIWILKNGVYYTPPISSGLLNGTYRRYLLAQEKFFTKERVLFQKDVEQADALFISNAIRGLLRVYFRSGNSTRQTG